MQSTLEAYRKFAKFKPNPMQAEVFTRIAKNHLNPALLLKAPTGSGKTESVLIPSLESGRRLFLIFPSRSLLEDQIDRCEKYLQCVSKQTDKSYALVIDTGAESVRIVFKGGKVLKKGDGISTMVMLSFQHLTNSCTAFSVLANLTSPIFSRSEYTIADDRIFSVLMKHTPTIRSHSSILNASSRRSIKPTWIWSL